MNLFCPSILSLLKIIKVLSVLSQTEDQQTALGHPQGAAEAQWRLTKPDCGTGFILQ